MDATTGDRGGRANFPIKRTLLNVTHDQLIRLDSLAQTRITTRSALVREALARFLREEEGNANV
jgi:hypothetical protein